MNAPGSIWFMGLTNNPPAASTVLGANDGLSVDLATGTIAQLGQAVGRVGDPAAITENREIPENGSTVYFGKLAASTNVIGLSDANGITQFNNSGNGYFIQWIIGIDSSSFELMSNGGDVVQLFGPIVQMRVNLLLAQPVFAFNAPVVGTGLGSSIRTSTLLLEIFAATDTTILVNDALGNMQINIDPTLIPEQFGWVKKLGSTANTITLNALSGLIFSEGTSAATFVFTGAGEAIQFQSDGTNIYIL